jgi:hypothetical protein
MPSLHLYLCSAAITKKLSSPVLALQRVDAPSPPSSHPSSSSFAAITEDKTVYALGSDAAVLATTTAPRKGSSLAFLTLPAAASTGAGAGAGAGAGSAVGGGEGTTVLVLGDKIGDAHAFPFPAVGSKRRHVVGHTASILTAVAGVRNGRTGALSLVTADRDEKIRVSDWPNAFRIRAYCLGHTRCVTFVRPVDAAVGAPHGAGGGDDGYAPGELLLSGGGDGTVRVWHAETGTLLHTLYVEADGGSAGAASSSSHAAGWRVSDGPHADTAMAVSRADDAGGEGGGGEGGGEGGKRGRGGGGKRGRTEGAGTASGAGAQPAGVGAEAAATTMEVEGGKEEAAAADGRQQQQTGGVSSSSIPDTAMGVTVQPAVPAVFPHGCVEIPAASSSSLSSSPVYAVFVEGEPFVRLLRVTTPPAGAARVPIDPLHVKAGWNRGTDLLQARLEQVGRVALPATCGLPRALAVAPASADGAADDDVVLLVGTTTTAPAASGAGTRSVYTVLAYTVRVGSAATATATATATAASPAFLGPLAAALADPAVSPADLNPAAVPLSIMSSNPTEYDKVMVASLK